MKIKINTLDEDIRTVVREQAETGHDGRQVSGHCVLQQYIVIGTRGSAECNRRAVW